MNSFPIVGKGDCSTLKVHRILRFSTSFHLFGEKWSDVARDLSIPEVDIQSVKGDMLLSKSSLSDALKQILDLWVGGNGEIATLETLVQSLERNGLADCGQRLQKEFQLYTGTAKKYVSIPWALKNLLNSDDFACGLIILTTLDIPITMEKIKENLTCKIFLNYEALLSFLSAGNDWSILVVTDEDPNTLANLLGNMSGNKPFDQTGKLVFVTNEGEKRLEEALAKRKLSSTCVRIVKDEMEWNDINLITKHEVRKRAEEYVEFRIEDKLVESALSGQVLADLINEKEEIQLVKSTLPEISSYYIKRHLLTRNIILEEAFKSSNQEDVFIFQGISRNELSSMIKDNLTANSSEQLKTVTCKFIVLDYPNHFDKICQLSNYPVHLLRKEANKKWRWVKSKGALQYIQNHVSKRQSQDELEEDDFLAQISSTTLKENTPVCISDSPGMGKSVLLANIGRNLKKMSPTAIVVFIALPELIKEIRKKDKGDLKDAVMSSWARLVCQNDLGKVLLKSKINHSDKDMVWIELLLDGFDEVDHSDLSFSHEVLTVIKTFNSCRLWVTTRPHLLEDLEKTLCVLGYNMQPFHEENQINFLARFWSERLEMSADNFVLFASTCLQVLKKNINSSEKDIAGIPLQCLMIAEIFQDEAKANAGSMIATNSTNSFTFIDLYDLLIKTKSDLYFKKHSTSGKLTKEEILDIHKWLSLKLLFPDYAKTLLSISEKTQKYSEEILKIGLLEASSTFASPRFIHRTFAEYLTAVFVVESLGTRRATNADFLKLFYDKLFHNKLSEENKEPELLNYTLQFRAVDKEETKFKIGRFLHLTICQFVNYLIPRGVNVTLPKSKYSIYFSITHNIILACVTHSLANVFKLLSGNPALKKLENIIFNKDLVYAAVRFADLNLIRLVLAQFEDHYEFTEEIKTEIFCYAICKMEFSVVEYFLKEKGCEEIMRSDASAECIRPFLSRYVFATEKLDDLSIAKRIEILRVLLNINEKAKHKHLQALIGRDRIHCRFIIELINLGADLSTKGLYGGPIIYRLGNWLNEEDCEKAIKSIPIEELRKLVSTIDEGYTPLNALLKNVELTFATLKYFNEAKADLNSRDRNGYSVLARAVMWRNCKTIRNLVKFGADVNWKGKNGESILHLAACNGNVEGVTYYLDELEFNVNIEDSSCMTPLDYSMIFSENKRDGEIERILSERGGVSNIGHFYIRSNLKISKIELLLVIRKLLENVQNNKVDYQSLANSSDFELRNLFIITWLDAVGHNSLPNWVTSIKKCSESSVDIIDHLVKSGANVYEKGWNGKNFLHLLLDHRRHREPLTALSFHDICEYLVAYDHVKLFIMADYENGYTPLHYAVKNIELEERTLQLLYNANVPFDQIDNNGENLLVHAVQGKRSDEMIRKLIQFGANHKCQNLEGWNLLHHCINIRNISGLKCFLNLGLSPNDVNNREQSPLILYMKKGYNRSFELTNLLCDSETDINRKDDTGMTALDYLIKGWKYNEDIKILKYLIYNGADLCSKEGKYLTLINKWMRKVNAGEFHEFVECLIQKNISSILEVKGLDNYYTPLHLAIKYIEVKESTLSLLNSAGVNLNSEDESGNSLLVYALRGKRSSNLINSLIKYGADMFQLGTNGSSLLHFAAQYGSVESLAFLIKRTASETEDDEYKDKSAQYLDGLDVNRQDNDRDTPLHCAMLVDDIKEVEEKVAVLLEAGADVRIKNDDGLCPFEIIMQNDDDNIEKDIKTKLAKLMFENFNTLEFTYC